MTNSNGFSRVVVVEVEMACFRMYLTSRTDETSEWTSCGIRGKSQGTKY